MTLNDYFKDWLKVIDLKELSKTILKLNSLYKERLITPLYKDVFKAFTLCSEGSCKVIFLGQDPYPQKDVATGIAFGNNLCIKQLSPSLGVIKDSVMHMENCLLPFKYFDITLESWGKQGVLMLNSALTCELNKPNSHTMLWRPFIKSLLINMSNSETGLIYVLFGEQAQTFEPFINKRLNYVFKQKHPAYYARINKPMPNDVFYEINSILLKNNGYAINWCTDI